MSAGLPEPEGTVGNSILLIDNSRALLRILKQRLQDELNADVELVADRAALDEALASPGRYRLAVSNLRLGDAEEGAAVDALLAAGVPTVVFTSSLDERIRSRLINLAIVDYIVKEGPEDIGQIIAVVRRIEAAARQPALVVDDSAPLRRKISGLLRRLGHPVHEVGSGEEALQVLAAHPEICLMLTDFYMPGVDGAALTRAVRRQRGPAELVVIGLSTADEAHMLARLLKAGADDFLPKPFEVEAFTSRVGRAMAHQELLRRAQEAARIDPVTRLLNRRALEVQAHPSSGAVVWVELVGGDAVLDRYGDDGLDAAMVALGQRLGAHLPEAALARPRDQALCAVLPPGAASGLPARLLALQRDVAALLVPTRRGGLRLQIAAGVSGRTEGPLADRLAAARAAAQEHALAAR
jgi:CheY-like chemotaxis protein